MKTDNRAKNLHLLATAKGAEPADLVLKGGLVLDVLGCTWEQCDVAITDGIIVGLGSYEGKQTIDVSGKYVTPGLMDAHMHIESTMLAPRELAKLLLLNGVTTIFADPHEIANVMGEAGLCWMLDETEDMPLDVFYMLPSCVPATAMETSGAELTAADLQKYLYHERVLGLAEMMNYPGLLGGDPGVWDKLDLVKQGLCDGHAPCVVGKDLNAYLVAGVTSDHEVSNLPEAKEKLSRGMYLLLREGSGAHNLLDLLPSVSAHYSRRTCLCTDDRHIDELLTQGSINYLVEMGVAHGYAPELLLQMATINTAERFRLYDRGLLAPGYKADINVFGDLTAFAPVRVFKNGQQVVNHEKLLWSSAPIKTKPASSVNLPTLQAEQLQIAAQPGREARVIKVIPEQIYTEEMHLVPKQIDGFVVADTERDVLKLAVWERHQGSGRCAVGLVNGFKLKRGAVASTVAHDSHNLIVTGTNDGDMVLAAQTVRDAGGLAVVSDGEVRAVLPLPIAGLMSDCTLDEVYPRLKQLNYWLEELGGTEENNLLMVLAFLALPVIPRLKITDKGLFDVEQFCFVDLWV